MNLKVRELQRFQGDVCKNDDRESEGRQIRETMQERGKDKRWVLCGNNLEEKQIYTFDNYRDL